MECWPRGKDKERRQGRERWKDRFAVGFCPFNFQYRVKE